ncbi:MAG: NTP transferase domain-containing protein [Patescibacteria group bacterium]
MSRQIIILAAGKGTRMNCDGPKVLQEVLGRPMIDYVLDSVEKTGLAVKPVVIIGFQGNKVRDQVGERAELVWQQNQFGTGHAVSCASEILRERNGDVLVLYGDTPLISPKTINNLFDIHGAEGSMITMMTTEVENFNDWRQGFYGFGRILRNGNNSISAIRELKDCSDEEKNIIELNPGYYCFNSEWLWKNIDLISNNNNQQQEYYLTDLVEMAVQQGRLINSLKIHPIECLGVNTVEQLKLVEDLLKQKMVKA